MKLINKYKTILLILFITQTIVLGQVSHSVNFSDEELIISETKGLDQINYTKILYNDFKKVREPGSPELPVKYVNLIVPSNQGVKGLKINITNKKTFNITNLVFPAQPDIPTSMDFYEVKSAKPNSQIYESENPFPAEVVKVVQDGYFDGSNHIITLAVYPVQYFPKANQLIFNSNIDITLEMENSTATSLVVRSRDLSSQKLYDDILNHMVDNPENISNYQVKPSQGDILQKVETQPSFYKYVVITSNALKNSFNKFVEWKKRKGINIGVVTIEDIYSSYTGDLVSGINDNAGKIRQYLKDGWYSGITVWALMGGDNTVVPIRYGCGTNTDSWDYAGHLGENKIPTDLYFADFNGDWDVDGDMYFGQPAGYYPYDAVDYNPEIFVGRLLTASSQEILNWTEKLIIYEQNPGNEDLTYLTRAFMHEADEMADDNIAEDVDNHLPASFVATIWKELPSGGSSNPTFPMGAQVITEMNNHYGYYNWFCHGSPTDITVKAPNYNQAPYTSVMTLDAMTHAGGAEPGNGLDNLTNYKYPALLYSIGCDNTPFDVWDPNGWHPGRNMGSGFTVITKAGGPAFLGNTRLGFETGSSAINKYFLDNIKLSSNEPESGEAYAHIGVSEIISKFNYNDHYLRYSHNLIGCPETRMWTNTPSIFTSTAVTDGGSYVTINAGTSGCDINVRSVDNGTSYNLTAYNVTSYTFNTSVRPLFVTINKGQYLPYTAITGGTINTNTSLWGKLNVLGNLTVASSKTLTVEQGTILNFRNNSALIVSGVLTANGISSVNPITFDFIAPNSTNQNGIRFNSGSSGNVNFCIVRNAYRGIYENSVSINISNSAISNCTDGIYLYSSSPLIQGCNIHHNSNSGINLIYSSPTIIWNNYIQNNYDGVLCSASSNPNFGSSGYPGWDDLRNNTYGVVCSDNSYPMLGNNSPVFGGANNLVNTSYNVYNMNSGVVYARTNWWGSTNPSNFKILGNVSYSPYQGSEIYLNPPPLSKTNGNNLIVVENENIPMISELDKAYQMIADKNYEEARNICMDLINNYPDLSVSYNALNLLKETYSKNEISSEKDIYISLLNKTEKKPLYALAGLILSGIDNENKIKHIDDVLSTYKNDKIAELALYEKFIYFYFEKEDMENALTVSKQLDNQFPNSQGSIQAHQVLGDEKYFNLSPKQEEGQPEISIETPKEYALLGNFPNPFNPSTTITYALPKATHVTLKIYDILGREVAELLNEEKQAGTYSVTFNALSLSSGIYFYSITAGHFREVKKMLLTK